MKKITNNLILLFTILFFLSSNGMQSIKKDWVIGGFSCVTGAAGVLNIAHQIYTKNYGTHRIFVSTALLSTGLASVVYLMWSKNQINNQDFKNYAEVYQCLSRCPERSFCVNYKKDDVDAILDMNRGDFLYIRKGYQTVFYDMSSLKGTFIWLKHHDKWILIEKDTRKAVPERRRKN